MLNLQELNDSQRVAVLWDQGPLLVLAGPGSGKTKVLTSRIAKVLEDSVGDNFRMLALTFTNKAAKEMRDRVEALVPGEIERARLATFHSFAAQILSQHGSHIGLRPDFQILTNDLDREVVLEEVLSELQKDLSKPLPAHFTVKSTMRSIDTMLEHCVKADGAEKWLKKRTKPENLLSLAKAYKGYRAKLQETNTLDFPSLIVNAIELLDKMPSLIKLLRIIYTHILVDEFQDTNRAQYAFLSRLAKYDPQELFVVADDDQIIYQWNGASPKRIAQLRKDFNVAIHQLPENYRCPEEVVQLANKLIAHNASHLSGKQDLKSARQPVKTNREIVRTRCFETADKETEWVAKDIVARCAQDQAQSAILARTRKTVAIAEYALEQEGLTPYSSSPKNEFVSAPLVMLHSILRLANAKEDKKPLQYLSRALYRLEGIRIEPKAVITRASADGNDLLRAWIDEIRLRSADLDKGTEELLICRIKPLLNSLRYDQFCRDFFTWADSKANKEHAPGVMDSEEAYFNEYEAEKEVWQGLTSDILQKFSEDGNMDLHQLLQELDLHSKALPKPPGAIPCFTIHASKGMEFGHVYLIGMVEDQLPVWSAVKKGDDSPEIEEERRNCFVAITRAQESLTMTYSAQVGDWHKEPSRFLEEMEVAVAPVAG